MICVFAALQGPLFQSTVSKKAQASLHQIHTLFRWFCLPLICELTLRFNRQGARRSVYPNFATLGFSLLRVEAVLECDFSADKVFHPGNGILEGVCQTLDMKSGVARIDIE